MVGMSLEWVLQKVKRNYGLFGDFLWGFGRSTQGPYLLLSRGAILIVHSSNQHLDERAQETHLFYQLWCHRGKQELMKLKGSARNPFLWSLRSSLGMFGGLMISPSTFGWKTCFVIGKWISCVCRKQSWNLLIEAPLKACGDVCMQVECFSQEGSEVTWWVYRRLFGGLLLQECGGRLGVGFCWHLWVGGLGQ